MLQASFVYRFVGLSGVSRNPISYEKLLACPAYRQAGGRQEFHVCIVYKFTICYTKRVENKFKFSKMKKFLLVFGLVAVLFGSAAFASAQTSASSQSALLADIFALMADLGRAISALVEKVNPSTDVSTPAVDTSKTPITGTTGTKTLESADVFIKVVSPNAQSERWIIGKTYEIKWEVDTTRMGAQQNPNFVSIYLVSPNSATKTPLWTVSPIVKNTGSYKWTVSKNVYAGEYQVAIEPYARPNLRATGSTFVIGSDIAVPPTQGAIAVNPGTPKVGDVLFTKNNTKKALTQEEIDKRPVWCCNNCYIESGGTCGGCFAHCNQDAPIGGNQGNEFKVKITNPSEANDAAWAKGNSYTIQWMSSDLATPLKETDYVSLYVVLAKDTSKNVLSISRKAYNDGDFRWMVAKSLSTGVYRIVLQSASNPALKVMSPGFFIVERAGVPPTGWQQSAVPASSTVQPPQQEDKGPVFTCCSRWIPGYGYWWCGSRNGQCYHCGCEGGGEN